MKNYKRFFYIFAFLLLIILSVKEYFTYIDKENVKKQVLYIQSQTLVSFLNSFREVYQKTFLTNHIKLNKENINFIPVARIPEIAKEFSEKIGGKIEIRLLSDNPRNPNNMANKDDLKFIKYFKETKKPFKFIHKNKEFLYYKPLYIENSCLNCHKSQKTSPQFIKENYKNGAYGYKLGDLRGIMKITIKGSDFVSILTPKFYKKMLIDFILYCLVLLIVWFLIKQIEKQERKHTKKLLEINEKLRKEKKNAELNAKAKSEFLANMSHEIRTPLNAMFGFIKLLEDKKLDDESIKYLSIIQKSGDMLLNVINDILDFSKIESGKLSIEKVSFNPKEEIELIYHLFESKASEKGINLYIREDNLEFNLISDSLRIKQIISNLLSNAIKFTSTGRNIYLSVEYNDKKEELYIEVKDEGIGISEKKLFTIFKPFTQADNSTTRKFGGTGLGLTISYKLVKYLGGELKVKSKLNVGSKFYFKIPVKKSDKIKPKKVCKEVENFDYTVLMVEDNKANQLFLGVVLKKLGIKFDVANDGIEAVEKYKENSTKYDLILMDENMPNMTGSEATIKIREFEKENNLDSIFIVAVTANALSGDKDRFLEVGMNDYIPKPIDIEHLKEIFGRFNEYLNNRSK